VRSTRFVIALVGALVEASPVVSVRASSMPRAGRGAIDDAARFEHLSADLTARDDDEKPRFEVPVGVSEHAQVAIAKDGATL